MSVYGLSQSTPPVGQVVATADLKDHLRIFHDSDDAAIAAIEAAAVRHFEETTYRQLLTAEYTMTLPCFPDGGGEILIPRSPLQSIEQIEIVEPDGDVVVMDAADYQVLTDREPGRVVAAYGTYWPATRRQPDAVRISFTAGHGAAADVDVLIQHAIKLIVGTWFENREDLITGTIVTPVPRGADRIMTMFDLGDEFDEYGAATT